ncbi:MAG: PilZ domain-containing protein [Candidatus Omnitrophota bacterium]|nr:MAG: PilZ domain-containing protein [Candidatus Omnitrophota bacterium]
MRERRKYVRMTTPLEVSYTVEGKEALPQKSTTKDISPDGVSFPVKEEIPKGSLLNINVKIPTRSDAVAIKAKVVWCGEGKDSCVVGLEFIHISEEAKQDFLQYLCNLMYSQLKNLNI